MHIAAAMVSLEIGQQTHRITASNQSMGAVMGCPCEQLVECEFLPCFHPEDAAKLARTMRQLIQQQQQQGQQVMMAAPSPQPGMSLLDSLSTLNTQPPVQPQQQPLWQVLTLRVCRKVHSRPPPPRGSDHYLWHDSPGVGFRQVDNMMVPASCRISLVVEERAREPLGFSFLIDGKQEYKPHEF